MVRRILIGAVVLSRAAALLWAQPGHPLPPRDDWPRTRAEYQAKSQEPWRQVPLGELVPDIWRAAWDRMSAMAEKYTGADVVYDTSLADQLIAELWVDTGHPALTGGVQNFVLDPLVSEVLRWPEERLPAEARDRIAAGLMAYVEAGGAEWTACHEALTASVLLRAAPDDPDAQALANDLLEDAVAWVQVTDSDILRKTVARYCAYHWGDQAQWRIYEIESREAPTQEQPADAGPTATGQLTAPPPSERRPESYDKAVAALRAVLQADPPIRPSELLERLRDAERAASVKQKDERLNDDLVCRLLIVYRTLLDRRPRIAFRTSAYIENQLLTLHTKGRLRTDRHWDLWSQAVKALESERLSKRFQRYLRARTEKKDLPAGEVKALEQLRPLLAE